MITIHGVQKGTSSYTTVIITAVMS